MLIMRTKRTRVHRLFNKFLRENGCKRKFYRNERIHYGTVEQSVVTKVEPESFMYAPFLWSLSTEGYLYWENISNKWRRYMSDNLKKNHEQKQIKGVG